MKKMILFFFVVFVSISLNAQKIPILYLSAIDSLVNKELKVRDLPESEKKDGYYGFYVDKKHKKVYKGNLLDKTKYEYLVGKIFKVLSYERYIDHSENYILLTLENKETGILYYPIYEEFSNCPCFVQGDSQVEIMSGIIYPEGFFCKDITENKDRFTDEITFSTPNPRDFTYRHKNDIKFVKDKNGIMLLIYQWGASLNVNQKGLILLLKNGGKIEKPDAELHVETAENLGGYIYSTAIYLSADDIKLLTSNEITDDRLYIYDGAILEGGKYKEYLKCLLKK